MHFECRHIAELPFNLNLPEGTYEVPVDGKTILMRVSQERIAAHLGIDDQSQYVIVSRAQLQSIQNFKPVFHQRLRTVLEISDEIEVAASDLHHPTDEELRTEMARNLIVKGIRVSGDALQSQVTAELAKMQPEALAEFARQVSIRLTARKKLPTGVTVFLRALNSLVRLYMVRFGDFFVEEVAIHQLAGMVTTGVLIIWLADGQVLETTAHVEKFPGMMRGQWYDHGEQAVMEFRDALRNGEIPDSVKLLGVRARGFLERGAYRSAIIESSAALETAITRRIQRGLTAMGKSDVEIAALLKTHEFFKERAKKLLQQATGTTAAALDLKLWQRVLAHREAFRHKIAHSDLEPTKGEAEAAVEHFLQLAKLVSEIP